MPQGYKFIEQVRDYLSTVIPYFLRRFHSEIRESQRVNPVTFP